MKKKSKVRIYVITKSRCGIFISVTRGQFGKILYILNDSPLSKDIVQRMYLLATFVFRVSPETYKYYYPIRKLTFLQDLDV